MKTKIFITLCSLFMLSSLSSKAHSAVQCIGGNFYYITWHDTESGSTVYDGAENCGGGCEGSWTTIIDRVVPSGHPTYPQISSDAYTGLENLTTSGMGVPSAGLISEIAAARAANPPVTNWVNPLSLSTDAYSLVYSGTTYYDIFYVYTSVDVSTGTHKLNLYSDANRTCGVVYKNAVGNTVKTENVTVLRGSNYVTLTGASTLPGGYYTLHVTTSSSNVSTGLTL